MGDFDRNAGGRSSGRGRFDRRSSQFGGRGRDRDRGRDRGGDRGEFHSRDGGRDRRTERHEMHPAVCDKCGKDCEVPFKPTQGKPIYCDDCYKNKSTEAGSRSEMGKPKSNETFDQLHKKLDKILRLLEGKKESVEQKEKPKNIEKKEPEVKKEKNAEKEEPILEYAQDIEKKKPKKKAKKKK